MIDDKQFIKIWHEEASVQAVADRADSTYYAVAQRAHRLRDRGKKMPMKRPSAEFMREIGSKGGKVTLEQRKQRGTVK